MNRIPRFSAVAIAALMYVLVAPAWAQEETDAAKEEATNLKPVVVTDTRIEEEAVGPVYGYKATQSATVTRTETSLQKVPRAIGVVTKEQVEDQNPGSLESALRYSAGVSAETYGDFDGGDYFSVRGSRGAPTMIDGNQQTSDTLRNGVGVDPFTVERLEVLRGPSSVISGQNVPGGVVNVVSKRPLSEPMRKVGVELGTYDHKQIHADLTGPLTADGEWAYRLVALAKDASTQVDHTSDDRLLVAPSVQWNYRPDSYLWLYGHYQEDKTNNYAGFFPVVGTREAYKGMKIPLSTFIGEPDWDKQDGTLHRVGLDWKHAVNKRLRVRSSLKLEEAEKDINGMYAAYPLGILPNPQLPPRVAAGIGYFWGQPPQDTVARIWYKTDEKIKSANWSLQVDGDVASASGAWQHTLMGRLDVLDERIKRKQYGNLIDRNNLADIAFAGYLNPFKPEYGNWQEPADANTRWYRPERSGLIKRRGYGITIQDQVTYKENLVITGSVRHDQSNLTTETVRDANGKPVKQNNSATTKNLGVVYVFDNGFAPYYSYSESFQPQAPDTSGKTFKPKTGRQNEVGLKWLSDDKRVGVTVAYYRLKELGRLREGATPGQKEQIKAVETEGFEADVHANLKNWDFIAQYTMTDAVDAETGLNLDAVPEDTFGVWAVYKLGQGAPGWKVGLGLRHKGRIWTKSNRTYLPSNVLADAMVSWQRGPWQASLNISNLADKEYVAHCADRGDCFYGEKRRVKLAVNYTF